MKQINYKLTACIALAFISLEVYAAGPDFTSDISISSFNPSIEFTDTTSGEADWSLCVDSDELCNMSAPSESFALSSNDEGNIKTPFRVDVNARHDALRLNGNNVGIGTATPAEELHVFSPRTFAGYYSNNQIAFYPGNPQIRLQSMGTYTPPNPFAPLPQQFHDQIWDISSNHLGFGIENETYSNTPFWIGNFSGNVGVGTTKPKAGVHVSRTSTTNIPDMFQLSNAGDVRFKFEDTVADAFWRMSVEDSANTFVITRSGTGHPELKLSANGSLYLSGSVFANVDTNAVPDYVFDSNYPLMKLNALDAFIKENKHLPNIPSQADFKAKGGQLNMTEMQLKLLEKVEELTLYTLAQQKTIDQQKKQISANTSIKDKTAQLATENNKLKERLSSLEKLVTNLASASDVLPSKGKKIALNEH